MKKKYVITIILAIMFMLLPLYLFAAEYQHSLESDDIRFSWTIEGDQIHVELSAKTTGWVAVGFDPEDAMEGANIIIGAVKDGKCKIEDHFGDRKRGHTSDEELGGKNDVINPSGTEENDITTIAFSFPLNTGEKYDKPINPEGTNLVMLAYGAGKDSFKNRHPFRTVYEINFSTGDNKKIK